MARTPKLHAVRGLFIDRHIGQILGLPEHVRQADHYIMATTKAEAVRLLEAAGHRGVRPSDLRVAMGNTATALAEAGVAEPGDLLVVRPLTFGPVVRVREGDAEVVGRTEANLALAHCTALVPSYDTQEA